MTPSLLCLVFVLFVSGKFAFFKAIVTGDPKPSVSWSRNNGDVSDTSRYQTKYDPNSNEHTFEASDTSYQITVTWKCSMLMWGSGKNSNEKWINIKEKWWGGRDKELFDYINVFWPITLLYPLLFLRYGDFTHPVRALSTKSLWWAEHDSPPPAYASLLCQT